MHQKHTSIIDNNEKAHMSQSELSNCRLISDFGNCYSQIRKNGSIYFGVESIGVSEIYSKSFCLPNENVVVFDTEISFKLDDENKIGLIFYY